MVYDPLDLSGTKLKREVTYMRSKSRIGKLWGAVLLISSLSYGGSSPVSCYLEGARRIETRDSNDKAILARLCSGAVSNSPIDCYFEGARRLDIRNNADKTN